MIATYGMAQKIHELMDELIVNANDQETDPFCRGQYANHIKACQLILSENYKEEQLKHHYKHVKSNLSTLHMVMNAFNGIMPDDVELAEEMEIDGVMFMIPSVEGQVEISW